MFIRNKGFTLIETVVVLFLMSIIILGSAMSMRLLGDISREGIKDITYRKDINTFTGEMFNGASNLLSVRDKSYNGISNSGIVINEVDNNPVPTVLPDGRTEKIYETRNITMYLKGKRQRRDIYIEDEIIHENKNMSLYGQLKMIDKSVNKDELALGNVVWDVIEDYDAIKVTTQQFVKTDISAKTVFRIITKDDFLFSIDVIMLIPTAKGANREFKMVFTCPQEVLVSVEP